MLLILLQCLTVDQNVIYIGGVKDVQNVRIQDIIDVVLECAWRICKTKEHDQVFVEFCTCAESSFPLFTLCHLDVVECRDNVKLGVPNCLAELIQGFPDQWQEVTVFDSNGVQALIVHAEMQSTSWLSDKENKCSGR